MSVNEHVHDRAAGWVHPALVVSRFAVVATACLGTVATVALVVLASPAATRDVALPIFLVGSAVIFGLGLSDLARAHEPRFAGALTAAGLLWTLAALATSDRPVLFSIGRVCLWVANLAIIYVLLSYPSGRLQDRAGRLVFAAAAAVVAVLYVPTALVATHFPQPGVWSACRADCPHNAFSLVHSTPAIVRELVVPLRGALTVGLFAGIAVVATRRARSTEPLLGQTFSPIRWMAIVDASVFALYFPLRAIAPGSWTVAALAWTVLFVLPGVAVAGVAGRLLRRVHSANALDSIARAVSTSQTPAQVRRALADALHDPKLSILHSFPGDAGSWVDGSGSPATLPADSDERGVTEVVSGARRIAIIHDPVLSEDPALVRTVGAYALNALENDQLNDQLRASLRELATTRARGIAAEDRERQKIERDLHDGAQQRLVAVRVKLGLAAGQLEDHDPTGAAVIRALGQHIDDTIDDVRAFARGIYPPLLEQTGLHDALRSVARSAALPTTVNAERLRRYSSAIETTVYFCCSESLQNAAKHARGATHVTISVWQDRALHFEIRDDGAGFDLQRTPYGTGLSNLQDRIAVVNGRLGIRSAPGEGTTVTGTIPLR